MKIIQQGEPYLPSANILVRVYDNQSNEFVPEARLFVGEILFREKLNRDPIGFSAQFPRGLVEFLKLHLPRIAKELPNETIQVANEIPNQVDHLTSCREAFDIRFNRELLPLL